MERQGKFGKWLLIYYLIVSVIREAPDDFISTFLLAESSTIEVCFFPVFPVKLKRLVVLRFIACFCISIQVVLKC